MPKASASATNGPHGRRPRGRPRSDIRRRPYPLRLREEVHAALERWSADELRSVNAQIEFLLRKALKEAGRLKTGESGE